MEKEQFSDACNEYVNKVEERQFVDLHLELEHAQKAAETCGCRQCKGYLEYVQGQMEQEVNRLGVVVR